MSRTSFAAASLDACDYLSPFTTYNSPEAALVALFKGSAKKRLFKQTKLWFSLSDFQEYLVALLGDVIVWILLPFFDPRH